jgi:hypothetical protein
MFEIIINSSGVPRLHVEGNRGPHREGEAADEWSLVSNKWNQQVAPARYRHASRFATWPITASNADEAFVIVPAEAGATRPMRDAVDARVVGEVRNGTGRIIDSPREVGGYPALASAPAPADADHDGMPDDWETAHGLDPRNPADGNARSQADGYTHLEEYLHSR